jgi:predicted ATPase
LNDANGRVIAQICQRLEGMPLAIELAAARVKALSIEQIDARLDDRFRLLTTGSRTASTRQQTLQATIDWSYDLLSEKERVLFRRLAVFAGGWALEAAEAVCSGDGIEAHAVLDMLSHLVEKSLVIVDEGEARYQLLETIRQYARMKLHDSDEYDKLSNRHLDYFLRFAEEVEPKLHGHEQPVWLDWLDAEHDNMRAALEWSQNNNQIEKGLQIAGGL